jgi:hypothetical protein
MCASVMESVNTKPSYECSNERSKDSLIFYSLPIYDRAYLTSDGFTLTADSARHCEIDLSET